MRHLYRFAALGDLWKSQNTLLDKKDQPVLIFDTCVHGGGTMLGVRGLLEKAGMQNIHTGTFVLDSEDGKSLVEPDFVYTTDFDILRCRPYGLDANIQTVGGRLYARHLNKQQSNLQTARHRRAYIDIITDEFHRSGQPIVPVAPPARG
jgi:hypothetical protein